MATTAERSHRINGEINVPELRLIGVENEQIGIVKTFDALRMAQDADVDLVEISPTAVPPVAKLMDYGKFKYSEQKKAHEAKLKQKVIEVKETVFRPQTDEHDYQVKLRKMREFLEEGDKCKVRMRFRGREMAHQEFGMQLLERVKTDLAELSTIEAHPKMEGRQMIMVLAPKKKK